MSQWLIAKYFFLSVLCFTLLFRLVVSHEQHFSSLKVLSVISPTSHAVANSFKRIIVIFGSVAYFGACARCLAWSLVRAARSGGGDIKQRSIG